MNRISFVCISVITLVAGFIGSSEAQEVNGHCSWAGMYATTVTPWLCGSKGVDASALANQVRYQLNGGVNGILVLGTLGEGMYADETERQVVVSTALESARIYESECGRKVKVLVGIHTGNLNCALIQAAQAKAGGADAIVVKYLGCPGTPFCEVLGFFDELGKQAGLPIFYYHHPSDMPRKLSRDEVVAVLSLPSVVGAKESILNLKEVEAHIRGTCGQGKVFLSGTALNLAQFRSIGGHGAICPEAALLPCETMQAFHACGRRATKDEQKSLFVLAPILNGGLTTENTARRFMTFAQDLKLPQQLPNETAQARMKAFLNAKGIYMSSEVKCQLPSLTRWDQHLVEKAIRCN